jgi:hypothetical protein
VSGQRLRERLQRQTDWASVHHWIDGLVSELEARESAGWPVDSASVDQVWITSDDDAVLLPFSTGNGTRESTGNHTHAPLLQQFAATIASADDRVVQRSRWPLRASAMLAMLAAEPSNFPALREGLLSSTHRAEPLTTRRRVLLGVATLAPTVLFALIVGGVLFANLLRDPEANRLSTLLGYLNSRRSAGPANQANRLLVGQYVAGHFRQQITSRKQKATGLSLVNTSEWRIGDSLVQAIPSVSAAQLAAADRIVDSTWKGEPPESPRPAETLSVVMIAMPICLSALAALLAALLARRGLVLRFFRLDVVTVRGSPAGRLRLFWRQLITWLGPLLLWGAGAALLLGRVTPRATSLAVAAIVLIGAAIYFVWRTPVRGLPERLSGTIVVPE